MKILIFISVLSIYSAVTFAEEKLSMPLPEEKEARDQLTFFVGVPTTRISIDQEKDGADIDYNPNPHTQSGIRLNIDQFNVELALPISDDKSGSLNSEQFDLILGQYWKIFGFDLFYHENKGFFNGDDIQSSDIVRPDLYTRMVGGTISYALKQRGFPLSNLRNINRVSGSGGTWLLQSSLSDQTIDSSSSLVAGNELAKLRSRTLTFGGGYAHQFVFNEDHLINLGMAIGWGPQWQESVGANRVRESQLRMGGFTRGSVNYAYYFGSWITGLSAFISQGNSTLPDGTEVVISGTEGRFFLTRQL